MPDRDLHDYTSEEFRAAIRDEASRIVAPMAEAVRRTGAQIQKSAENEALERAKEILGGDPRLEVFVNTDEGRLLLENALSGLPPQALEDDRSLISTAYAMIPFLPEGKRQTAREPSSPRLGPEAERARREMGIEYDIDGDIGTQIGGTHLVTIDQFVKAQQKPKGRQHK